MDFMNHIEDRLLDELKDISKKMASGEEISSQCLDDVKDISIALSKLATYQAMKEGGYSHDSGYSRNRMRDNMGRYSRRMENDWGRDSYYN